MKKGNDMGQFLIVSSSGKKSRTRVIVAVLTVFFILALFSACVEVEPEYTAVDTQLSAGSDSSNDDNETNLTDGGRLYVFNWGHFIYEPVLRMFEDEYNIRVIYSTYATNEEMYARVVGGGAQFDVLFPSDYMIERMATEGLLRPLNWDNLPNREHIDEKFWYWQHDPQNIYSMPYMWGTFGLLYNTNMVTQPVYSWEILWDEQFDNNIFMYDSSRCSIGVAQKLLGFSMNSTDPGELELARNLMIEQAPLVRAFLGDQVIDSMINEEAALATVFSGDARWIIYYNENHNFVNPQEGVQLFIDSMVIPANSRNPENAELFINFMTRPDIAYLNTRYIRYSTTNASAFAMLPDYWQNCPIYWPDDDVLARGEVFVDLGEFRADFERAWTQVMVAGN